MCIIGCDLCLVAVLHKPFPPACFLVWKAICLTVCLGNSHVCIFLRVCLSVRMCVCLGISGQHCSSPACCTLFHVISHLSDTYPYIAPSLRISANIQWPWRRLCSDNNNNKDSCCVIEKELCVCVSVCVPCGKILWFRAKQIRNYKRIT